ncbi:MAG: 50S ribosomal protein L22 [Actinobacteria bacterium]|nr:50S ribosomal protein L22 [Actinomycetota bacterium]
MQAKAVAKYIRVTPRKARQVADLIRGKEVEEALKVLNFCPKAAAKTLSKVVKSAAHNAEHNYNLKDKLFVTAAYVDQGPTLKRFRPRAMGRASSIHKKTSHITVVVGNREEV